jgi:hypothetical protein
MKSSASALLRFLAAGGLWLLIAILIIPTLMLHWVSGAGLFVIAELKTLADELVEGAMR